MDRPRSPSVLAASVALLLAACARGPAAPAAPRAAAPAPVGEDAAVDVARLGSPDFVVRSRAAERLVARGPGALDALGRAGEARVAGAPGTTTSATAPVVAAILEREDVTQVARHLASPWRGVRQAAADALGRRGGWDDVPVLVAALEDADADVRQASAAALRRITNQFFGFRATADARTRSAAVRRWRRWWDGAGRGSARDASSVGWDAGAGLR